MSQPSTARPAGIDPAATAALAALASEHASKSEELRRSTPEIAEAIRSVGFCRYFVPARWGGTEGDFTGFVEAVARVAEGDPSAAWCASIAATMGRMAAFLPEEGQRLLWQDGPDTAVVGSLMPSGHARAVPGGWEIDGRWAFVSGIHDSDFALLCTPVPQGDAVEVRFLLVPRESWTVEETWDSVGMAGTGSHTLVLEPRFVPAEHSFTRESLFRGTPVAAQTTATRVPLPGVSGLSFAAPVLGAVRGALTRFTDVTAARLAASAQQQNRMSTGTEATVKLALARADGEADAALLLLERAARQADAGTVDQVGALRAHRDYALAVDLLLEAVNRLFRAAGTRAQSGSDPLQRLWRDVNSAAGHAVLQWEPAARGMADHLLTTAGDTRRG
ncbi:hypothetical protein [Streptacidiphilus jiangxiensis]|uniref:Two-component flavin-dependent monooxygenase/oxygenase LndZ5 n=1 Tax=Streptacidiphilus jiangxiensis TaxID=235985 RepID=A0A1H7JN80_STRJI|nr:hypothetical protein [Streptacidiphilus jiangxiensis]SEK76041.1 two-component flavin-dependent monooxygenase/oxygenase LndZ5 [Streptacidiphilus jiangxiensis]